MYGMINEAIKRMVTEQYGTDAWEEMASRASADVAFLRMNQYPDVMTYELVAAASEMLGTGTDQILEQYSWQGF